jgi:hypothetical protein
MSYILKHYYMHEGNVVLTNEFEHLREYEEKDAALLVALDSLTEWVSLGMFIYSTHEGVAIVRQIGEGDEMEVVETFPAIYGITPLHKLTYRASHEDYCRAVDQLCATGECEWEDLGTGRRYRYSDETQKHVRLESLPAAA